jgi:hypothetical protein
MSSQREQPNAAEKQNLKKGVLKQASEVPKLTVKTGE